MISSALQFRCERTGRVGPNLSPCGFRLGCEKRHKSVFVSSFLFVLLYVIIYSEVVRLIAFGCANMDAGTVLIHALVLSFLLLHKLSVRRLENRKIKTIQARFH